MSSYAKPFYNNTTQTLISSTAYFRCWDSNNGSLMSKVATLPTSPQPQSKFLVLKYFLIWTIRLDWVFDARMKSETGRIKKSNIDRKVFASKLFFRFFPRNFFLWPTRPFFSKLCSRWIEVQLKRRRNENPRRTQVFRPSQDNLKDMLNAPSKNFIMFLKHELSQN